ncbi:hypothetical protein [Granulicella sp. WH15]|uniref:hypothetical protein n=1 Tax=Granulicella sp. WH15 TaxID=2602070 RepID=UPI00157716E9|nr:hypothetical protein [Granulicella sp. WH15]
MLIVLRLMDNLNYTDYSAVEGVKYIGPFLKLRVVLPLVENKNARCRPTEGPKKIIHPYRPENRTKCRPHAGLAALRAVLDASRKNLSLY